MRSSQQWQRLLLLLACAAAAFAPRPVCASHVMTEDFAQHLLDTGRLVQRFNGRVDAGASQLFAIEHRLPLLLLLRSLSGDADLYVSGGGRSPSPDDYELKSESFSLDLVFVTDDVIKPRVSALVYASPQCSENASFVLELYRHDNLLDDYSLIRDQLDAGWLASGGDYSHRRRRSHSTGAGSTGSADSDGADGEAESVGSFLYNLVVQLGRLLLFILEVAVET